MPEFNVDFSKLLLHDDDVVNEINCFGGVWNELSNDENSELVRFIALSLLEIDDVGLNGGLVSGRFRFIVVPPKLVDWVDSMDAVIGFNENEPDEK